MNSNPSTAEMTICRRLCPSITENTQNMHVTSCSQIWDVPIGWNPQWKLNIMKVSQQCCLQCLFFQNCQIWCHTITVSYKITQNQVNKPEAYFFIHYYWAIPCCLLQLPSKLSGIIGAHTEQSILDCWEAPKWQQEKKTIWSMFKHVSLYYV